MINDGICGYLILRQTRVTIFWIGTVAKPWGQVLGAKKNGTKRQELHFGMEKNHMFATNTKEISKSKRGLAISKLLIRFVIMLKVTYSWFQIQMVSSFCGETHIAHRLCRFRL